MPFLSFLLILLSGAGFLLGFAYLLRQKLAALSKGLMLSGVLVALLLAGLWLVEVAGWERKGIYKQLMYGLENEPLQHYIRNQGDIQETVLIMMSQSATALRQMKDRMPEDSARIAVQLSRMANYVTNHQQFSIWKNKRNWEQQLFFLAHASIVIGHYQSATGDEAYNEQWTSAANFLLSGISRSQYKHLASRPADEALRPADNAAALYALKIFDDYHGTPNLAVAGEDWSEYIKRELAYEDTQLPCAGFTATNRCRLPSVGTSLAMLTAYSASAELPIARDFWREFRYYHKETFVNVTGWINPTSKNRDLPEFCDFSVEPLVCGRYQDEFALQAAAVGGNWLTYYQLNNMMLLHDLFHPVNQTWERAPQEQVYSMLELATRLAALSVP
ncbi:MAG: hypothetical protein R2795_08950 [Saprospiraceae bacterium]